MHQYFPDLVPSDESRTRQIFHDGAISLDTNVILIPYRQGELEKNAWLDWIEQSEIKSRLFLPFQIQHEMLNNRESMINGWSSAYVDMITKIEVDVRKAKETLRQKFPPRRYPHIRYPGIDTAFDQAVIEIRHQVDAEQARTTIQHVGDLDPIYDRLQAITLPGTGQPFSEDERQKVYQEGRVRYSRSIPPGYEDAKEKPDPQRFGDLLIWEQLIKEAKEKQKPIIFVTNDLKADWFEQTNPRRSRWELHMEFFQRTGQVILIWPLERFQSEAHKYLTITKYELPTQPSVIQESSLRGSADRPEVSSATAVERGAPVTAETSGNRDENGVLLTQVLPSGPVTLTCFEFHVAETEQLRLDPTRRQITFDPAMLSAAERLAFAQWGSATLGLIATSGLDQHTLINAYGTANGEYRGELYRAWLIPDHYNNNPGEFFPTALIRL